MTTTNTAAVETMRAAIGQLLNEFGERQWQSGRGVPHKSLEDAFDAIIERAALAAPAQPVTVPWENFPSYLIDHCEGDVISEEGLQFALSKMLSNPQYAPQPAAQTQTQEDVGGWRRAGALLYRLTGEHRPTNFDEIRVTMANGSRDIGQMSVQAERLLAMLTAPQPPTSAEPTQPAAWKMDKDTFQFLSDVMTAAGLVEHGKQCKALAKRLNSGVMAVRETFQARWAHIEEMIDAAMAAQKDAA